MSSGRLNPYYQQDGVTIYCGDARDLVGHVQAEAIITDPVWPNSVFPAVDNPRRLLSEVLHEASVTRVVVHLGCDSDPRFLGAVPDRWPFFRVCWLEYVQPCYKGRILNTADIAYAFGAPPPAKPGAMVIPGKYLSTKSDKLFIRGTKRRHHKGRADQVYQTIAHPAARRLQHVRWLAKWFGGASVLDPFGGSGTTAVACKALGIPCTLIEIEERFCELAVNRLKQGVLALEELATCSMT